MPAAASLSPAVAPIVGPPARRSATADRTTATGRRPRTAVATAREDAGSARCSARRAPVAVKRLRCRSSRVLTSPCIARTASSNAAATVAAGMAAARAGGIGTECRADSSVVRYPGRALQRRRAKIQPRLTPTRGVCLPPTAATLDASRRSCAICSSFVMKPIAWRSTSHRQMRCASTDVRAENWPKPSAPSRSQPAAETRPHN